MNRPGTLADLWVLSRAGRQLLWRFRINLEESLPQTVYQCRLRHALSKSDTVRQSGMSLESALIKIPLSFCGAAMYRLLSPAIYDSINVTTAFPDPALLQSTGNPSIIASHLIIPIVHVTDCKGSLK